MEMLLFGRWMLEEGSPKRYASQAPLRPTEQVFIVWPSSCIVKIFPYLESCSFTRKPSFIMLTNVSLRPAIRLVLTSRLLKVKFYVVTEHDAEREHVVGYFCKVDITTILL